MAEDIMDKEAMKNINEAYQKVFKTVGVENTICAVDNVAREAKNKEGESVEMVEGGKNSIPGQPEGEIDHIDAAIVHKNKVNSNSDKDKEIEVDNS